MMYGFGIFLFSRKKIEYAIDQVDVQFCWQQMVSLAGINWSSELSPYRKDDAGIDLP